MPAQDRAQKLRLMAFDVDGVLTDGTLYFTAQGDEMKAFSSIDGHGLKMLAGAGVRLAIITGRSSRAVALRAQNLGIDLLCQGVEDKRGAMQGLLDGLGLDFADAGYMGDDVVDLPLLCACAFSASVPGGHAAVRERVDYVSRAAAGHGAVREVCELILSAQGKLDAALAPYLAPRR
ncbi:3-deoxy-D-manno-octulosonate 8-phosphate phosphatase KdsC [mine drainage metagenome]|uniref:3-deoxy-D-manno-octulosonate 8-phosphate phosphatase KdsC n=1 Tax=mine drainage metagenome TaxID=410659 RepID=A0A1J5SBW1_9ZZZZ